MSMSINTPEARQQAINENIPLLIKEVTGLQEDDEIFKRCKQSAFAHLRNHRHLSVNSHEVRRKIEAIKERFRVENLAEYADYLERLTEVILNNEYLQNHYEVDLQWCILDFLFSLPYRPIKALKLNKPPIEKIVTTNEEQQPQLNAEIEALKAELRQDFIANNQQKELEDSDLSDWSDDTQTGGALQRFSASDDDDDEVAAMVAPPAQYVYLATGLPALRPPAPAAYYTDYDSSNAMSRLHTTVQHSWWLPLDENKALVESTRLQANFALIYANFRRQKTPATVSEWCLLREIIWMFFVPGKFKFFNLTSQSQIVCRSAVTIPSVTEFGLQAFLQQHFLPAMNMLQTLHTFIAGIYKQQEYSLAKTIECYAAALNVLLAPIEEQLLQFERKVIQQPDGEILTLLQMRQQLLVCFQQLHGIYEVHRMLAENLFKYPAHIASAYLLTSLLRYEKFVSSPRDANLAFALFLSAVKVYCNIADTWWSQGRLDDWQQEFLVERCKEQQQHVRMRPFKKNQQESFFVSEKVSQTITDSSFFQLLLAHSLEAGFTLNLLHDINRIAYLKEANACVEEKLYEVFIKEVLQYVSQLQGQRDEACKVTQSNAIILDAPQTPQQTTANWSCLSTQDPFLRLAFTATDVDKLQKNNAVEPNALQIFEHLQRSKYFLPLNQIILKTLSGILKQRIAFANSFVVTLYREEFALQQHLCHLRRVFLLEASDVMHAFIEKLFAQIESNEHWANPFVLTTQLDEIVCSKFANMSSLFSIEILTPHRCQTNKVTDAINELHINYTIQTELRNIISEQSIDIYNRIFKFLLKVKWGISTLCKMRFARSSKPSYIRLDMADLLKRRLEQVRFWMLYAMQELHSHLMTYVLQHMGSQLESQIAACENLEDIQNMHQTFIETVNEHCFLSQNFASIKLGIEQLINLVWVLRLEWLNCQRYIENSNPLAPVDYNGFNNSDSIVGDSLDVGNNWHDFAQTTQINEIEITYVRCHQYLANQFNNEVYLNQQSHLSGLSAGFNTSLPY